MANETDNLDKPTTHDDSAEFEKKVQETLNRIANKASKRAGTRQQRYDQEHGISTK